MILVADQRILAGSAATVQLTLRDQYGEPDTASTTVTCQVSTGAGVVVLASANATSAGNGLYTRTLTRAQTAQIDRLSAVWAVSGTTVATTAIDVTGAVWFGLERLRAEDGMSAVGVPALVALRTWWEDLADNATGVAWVPRYTRETLTATGSRHLVPRWPRVRQIRSVTVDGTAQTAAELTEWDIDGGAALVAPTTITAGAPVIVEYTHGYDGPPEDLIRGGLAACRFKAVGDRSGVSPRLLGQTNEFGSFRFAAASERWPTGLPEVDAALALHSHRVPAIA